MKRSAPPTRARQRASALRAEANAAREAFDAWEREGRDLEDPRYEALGRAYEAAEARAQDAEKREAEKPAKGKRAAQARARKIVAEKKNGTAVVKAPDASALARVACCRVCGRAAELRGEPGRLWAAGWGSCWLPEGSVVNGSKVRDATDVRGAAGGGVDAGRPGVREARRETGSLPPDGGRGGGVVDQGSPVDPGREAPGDGPDDGAGVRGYEDAGGGRVPGGRSVDVAARPRPPADGRTDLVRHWFCPDCWVPPRLTPGDPDGATDVRAYATGLPGDGPVLVHAAPKGRLSARAESDATRRRDSRARLRLEGDLRRLAAIDRPKAEAALQRLIYTAPSKHVGRAWRALAAEVCA